MTERRTCHAEAEEESRLLGPRGGRVIWVHVFSLIPMLIPLLYSIVFISIDSPGAPHACYLEETGDELRLLRLPN